MTTDAKWGMLEKNALRFGKWSFGVREENHFSQEELDIFPGHAILEGGYLYANDQPGLGIDIDEAKAAQILDAEQAKKPNDAAEDRKADGSVVRP